MIIIPAIDLKDRQVVRLSQGKMDQSKTYSADPLMVAENIISEVFAASRQCRLHIIDLNGAFEGRPVHFDIITEIAKAYPGNKIEVGGGIRNLETIEKYFNAGASFCILGTAAIKNPQLLRDACKKFPRQIILGVDAKNGMVATEGWDQTSRKTAIELIDDFKNEAIESIIYTDIAKDGMLQGMNHKSIIDIANNSPFPIIASGGFTSFKDIQALINVKNIMGVIVGKAFYETQEAGFLGKLILQTEAIA